MNFASSRDGIQTVVRRVQSSKVESEVLGYMSRVPNILSVNQLAAPEVMNISHKPRAFKHGLIIEYAINT